MDTQGTTHPYTCNSCQVAFRTSDLQRTHMRSDWHRYNLKRRVASLPPLTAETFAEKVISAQESTKEEAAKASFSKFCEPCARTYYSENAYTNHLGSLKHKQKVQEIQDDQSMISSLVSFPTAPTPSTESGSVVDGTDLADKIEKVKIVDKEGQAESTEDPLTKCLFCPEILSNVYFNISHMARTHGLFIPEREYLADIDGLITYLHEKINKYNECLYCGRMKNSAAGILEHMKDKGHCMIAFETEDEKLEIGQYYDFRSTYSDYDSDEDDDTDGIKTPQETGPKLGASRKTKTEGEDDEGWETDSSSSSTDSEEIGAVPLEDHHLRRDLSKHPHHSQSSRTHLASDGYHSHAHSHSHAVFRSEYELFLPTGRAAGHRSLNRYFRQNLHNYPGPGEEPRAITNGEDEEGTDRGRSRQLARSNLGMLGVSEHKKKEVKAMEKRERRNEGRQLRLVEWQRNKQSNNQKHFRDPLLGKATG